MYIGRKYEMQLIKYKTYFFRTRTIDNTSNLAHILNCNIQTETHKELKVYYIRKSFDLIGIHFICVLGIYSFVDQGCYGVFESTNSKNVSSSLIKHYSVAESWSKDTESINKQERAHSRYFYH